MTAEADAAPDGCTLCGLELPDPPVTNEAGATFCCTGCREVHATLDAVEDVDAADLDAAGPTLDEAGPPPDHERAFLRVDGMHCTTCEAFLETVADRTDGVEGAAASYVTELVRVDYDPDRRDEDELAEALSRAGYTARPNAGVDPTEPGDETLFWRLAAGAMLGMWVMLPYLVLVYPVHFGVVYPGWMLDTLRGMLTSTSAQYFFAVMGVFTALVLGVAGGPLLSGAAVSLRTRSPNMDLLVSLAALSAFGYSTVAFLLGRLDVYYDVTVAVVLVVTAGRYYESAIKRRATDRLAALTAAQVDEATRYGPDGETTVVDLDELAAGDRVLVRAGERVPVDGTVVDGEGTVDEGVVTGESLPVPKVEGDAVVGGSVLADGALVVEVGPDATSSLDRLANLVWSLQSARQGVQGLADRLAGVFVPVVVSLAVLAGGAYLALGAGPAAALLVALTVLLVSCPCALGLATPMAVAAGIREALERSIVVFDQTVFERLRSVDVVVFDKTGTLTTGELAVLDAVGPPDLLEAAAALERRASHPVARAIVEAFGAKGAKAGTPRADGGAVGADGSAPSDVEEFRRRATGVEGIVDGAEVAVGHPDRFRERGWELPADIAERAAAARERGRLPVVVGRDGRAEGVVVTGDEPRDGWEMVVEDLADRGVEVVVLTGDESAAAAPFREHPAVASVFAGVPPEAKAETVRRLGGDRRVAMVGDGTNDAPALAAADLGIALGGGTAMAADAADVAIVDDDLASVGRVFDLSAATGRRVKQNIGWAFGYNAVAIPLAVANLLNPLFATVAMAASSLLVVTNSSRDLLDDSAD
ncbi:MAG: heavy metal translocating P-type ATPase [Halobacteriales archaeon]